MGKLLYKDSGGNRLLIEEGKLAGRNKQGELVTNAQVRILIRRALKQNPLLTLQFPRTTKTYGEPNVLRFRTPSASRLLY